MSDQESKPTPVGADPFDALLARAARLTPVRLAAQLHPGRVLCGARFEIAARLGSGGMGVVHEALDRRSRERVALKALSNIDPTSIYRLKNEFRTLVDIVHPNLVRLHELFASDELWFFTMELVRGEPFDRWVRPQGVLDLPRLQRALAQTAAGVAAVHAAGKLHRDLKPSNVLVSTADERVVILDFGLVADPELGGTGQTLDGGAVLGTPHYMAPEQAAAERTSAASDLYALGVMLFEALTGRLPFDGEPRAIMHDKQQRVAPRARALRNDTPGELDELCARLLARDPGERPSAADVAAALGKSSQLTAARSTRNSAFPRPPVLLGREAEQARLERAYTSAETGHPTLLRVTGESGIGKSTLIATFLDEKRAQGACLMLSGSCYERESLPYKAFDRVVDALTRHMRQLSDVDVASLLPRDIGALASIFPVLARIDLVAQSPTRPASDAHELRRRAFASFAELLGRLRDRRMLVLHIDDAQWIDHDSTLLLEYLLIDPELSPVLFVLSYQGGVENEAPLLARVRDAAARHLPGTSEELVLEPLSLAAGQRLALTHLAAHPDAAGLAEIVAKEAGGSPFFLGEIARHARDLPLSAARGAISLEHALRERIELLSDGARGLLELLVVAARPTPFSVLVAALDTPGDAQRWIDELRAAQFLRDTGAHSYVCYHDRIRTSLGNTLSATLEQARHSQLARAWLAHGDADPAVLFRHFASAGLREDAGRYAVLAAQKTEASLAYERAASFWEQALLLLPAEEIERLDVRTRRAEALSLAGRWAPAAHAFDEAAAHAVAPALRASLLLRSAIHELGTGDGSGGVRRLREVLEQSGLGWPRSRLGALAAALPRLLWLRVLGARRLLAHAHDVLAPKNELHAPSLTVADHRDEVLAAAGFLPAFDWARGLYFLSVFATRATRAAAPAYTGLALSMVVALFAGVTGANAWHTRLAHAAASIARTRRDDEISSATLTYLSYGALIAGKLEEAYALAQEARDRLEASGRGDVYGVWAAELAQASALTVMGRLSEAAACFAANARLARDLGNDMAMVGGDSVIRYLAVGDVISAHALLEHKLQLLSRAGQDGLLQVGIYHERVLLALYQGRGDDALELSRTQPRWLTLFDSGVLVALGAVQTAPKKLAQKLVRRALSKLRWRGERPMLLAVRAQLRATLCALDGDEPAMLEHLAQAEHQYTQAGMTLHAALMLLRRGQRTAGTQGAAWVAQAEARLQACGVDDTAAWAHMLAPLGAAAQRA